MKGHKKSASTKKRPRAPGTPRRGRLAGPDKKRMTIYLALDVYSAICDEADLKHVSLGELVTEAFRARMMLVAKSPT